MKYDTALFLSAVFLFVHFILAHNAESALVCSAGYAVLALGAMIGEGK